MQLINIYPIRSGKGVAYLTDTSIEGRTGLVVVDLGTGQSWRHLEQHRSTMAAEGFVPNYNGQDFMDLPTTGVYTYFTVGANGVTLSPDGKYLYYSALSSRSWWRIRTDLLRVPAWGPGSTTMAVINARQAVEEMPTALQSHSTGMEGDAHGNVYMGGPEQNAIFTWNPESKSMDVLVRNGMIQWPDTLALAQDGLLYFTANQLWL
jgi:sugar lactone lactonase YvrE